MIHSEKSVPVGHIPSGLFIVAVEDRSGKTIDGYLASWVQQVSFVPLMISLAIKPGRPAYELIKAGHVFGVNIVGEHDKSYLKHFWKGYDPSENPFTELSLTRGPQGGIFLNQAKSVLECQMRSFSVPGDHEVIFAEVLSSQVFQHESRPICHVRKTGDSY